MSSSNININKNPNPNQSIQINYPKLRVDNPQIAKDDLGKISIQSTYIGKPNEPNVIYSNTSIPQNYQAEKLFVYGKMHNINIDYDAELIIKNKSQTSHQIIYTIFLLKTRNPIMKAVSIILPTISQDIDTLLQNPTQSTHLAITPNTDTYIVYTDKSGSQQIVINTEVIYVQSDLSNYTNTIPMFSTTIPKYDIVKPTEQVPMQNPLLQNPLSQKEGFSIDATNNKLVNDSKFGDYLECDMVDINSPEQLSYVIPAQSEQGSKKSSVFASSIYYVITFFATIAVYYNAPFIYNQGRGDYKDIFLGLLGENLKIESSNWFNRLSNIFKTMKGFYWTLAAIILFIPFFIAGLVTKITPLTGISIDILLFYIVGVFAIKYDTPLQNIIETFMNN
jgi:hypothetical protein